MHYTIYQTTNNINGKTYIGMHQTDDINDGYLGSGNLLLAAIRKYGKENFTKETLHAFDSAEEMIAKEVNIVNEDFIVRTDTYNICLGGFGGGIPGRVVSQETRNRISAARSGQKLGPMSEESRRKKSIAHSGKTLSEEHKKNLSISKKGKPTWNKGLELTDQHKQNISKNSNPWNKGLVLGPQSKETRLKISKSKSGGTSTLKGTTQPTVICPHCDKAGGRGSMHRWHFDNCKFITEGVI